MRKISYRYRCLNCGTCRDFGAARLQCEIKAGQHARKRLTHKVVIEQVTVLHVFDSRENMNPLFHVEGDPPF